MQARAGSISPAASSARRARPAGSGCTGCCGWTRCPLCGTSTDAGYARHARDGTPEPLVDRPRGDSGREPEPAEDWFIPQTTVELVRLDDRWRQQDWALSNDRENLHRGRRANLDPGRQLPCLPRLHADDERSRPDRHRGPVVLRGHLLPAVVRPVRHQRRHLPADLTRAHASTRNRRRPAPAIAAGQDGSAENATPSDDPRKRPSEYGHLDRRFRAHWATYCSVVARVQIIQSGAG